MFQEKPTLNSLSHEIKEGNSRKNGLEGTMIGDEGEMKTSNVSAFHSTGQSMPSCHRWQILRESFQDEYLTFDWQL